MRNDCFAVRSEYRMHVRSIPFERSASAGDRKRRLSDGDADPGPRDPAFTSGRDVLGQAQTGTGKTAAFALPMLQGIDLEKKVPQVLVLTPTRKLAIQVAEAFSVMPPVSRGCAPSRFTAARIITPSFASSIAECTSSSARRAE